MEQLVIHALRGHPECCDAAAVWFSQKWGIPVSAYQQSIQECIRQQTGVPQWYLVLNATGQPISGAGVIENDFHDRKDLRPNLCALFVEQAYRNQKVARFLLDFIRTDFGGMGFEKLYLVTEHDTFYKKCGWNFFTLVTDNEGQAERMYIASTLR